MLVRSLFLLLITATLCTGTERRPHRYEDFDYERAEARVPLSDFVKRDGSYFLKGASDYRPLPVITDRLVVRVGKGVFASEVNSLLKELKPSMGVSLGSREYVGAYRYLYVDGDVDLIEFGEQLRDSGLFVYVGLEFSATPTLSPNDDYYVNYVDRVWHLDQIRAPAAWDITTGSSDILIAVIDDGIDSTHIDAVNQNGDLYGNYDISVDWDVANNDSVPEHYYGTSGFIGGHGTVVTGMIGAMTNSSVGTAGVAGGDWASSEPGVRTAMFKFDERVAVDTVAFPQLNLAAAFDSARVRGADIISLSFAGIGVLIPALESAILAAHADSCLIIAASGNDDASTIYIPARLDEIAAVGGSDTDDHRYVWDEDSGSNWGLQPIPAYGTLMLVAPAINIWTPVAGGGYDQTYHGTSIAAPQVAAAAGLVLSIDPTLTPYQVMERLCSTAYISDYYPVSVIQLPYPYGAWNREVGFGRLDLYNALIHTRIRGLSSGDTLNIADDIFIKRASTLTIPSGVTLRFAAGKGIDVKGTLIADGVTFTSGGSGVTWSGIETSTRLSEIDFTDCEIENATTGVLCDYSTTYNYPVVKLDGCTIHDNGTGVHLTRAHSTSSYIKGCDIRDNVTGIKLEYCNVPIGVHNSWSDMNVFSGQSRSAIYLITANPIISCNEFRDNHWADYNFRPTVAYESCYGSLRMSDFADSSGAETLPEYDVYSYASSPSIYDTWFYGAETAELYVTNGGYPYIEDVNFHTTTYDNGNNPPGSARWAIYFNSSGYIEDGDNWYGTASPTWSSIVYNDNRLLYQSASTSPSRDLHPKVSSGVADVRPEVALMRQADQAELSGDMPEALRLCKNVVDEYQDTPAVNRALARAFVIMTNAGTPQAEMEAYFEGVAASGGEFALDGKFFAKELQRQTMAWHGDLSRAISAYRSVAEDAEVEQYRREAAWLRIAHLADENDDKALLSRAIEEILSFGDSTETANLARLHWAEDVDVWARPAYGTQQDDVSLVAIPNPANPSTTVRFSIGSPGRMRLTVYNVTGQLVRTLVEEERPAGVYAETWDGLDATGREVASGVYVIRLYTPTAQSATRVTLVR